MLYVNELFFFKTLWTTVLKTKANVVELVKSPVIVIHGLLPRCLPSVK